MSTELELDVRGQCLIAAAAIVGTVQALVDHDRIGAPEKTLARLRAELEHFNALTKLLSKP